MIYESLLPICSCVKIKNNAKMIMIAGYLPFDDEQKIMYDYIGIYPPIGIKKSKRNITLNKDYIYFKDSDIEKVIYIGYSDDKSEFYRKYLLDMKNKFNNLNGNLSPEAIKKIFNETLTDIKNKKSEV